MDVTERLEVVRELCSFEGRLAGTDAERRAANRLAERLREMGRAADVEPTYVHPQYALIQAAHCVLGFAGSLLSILSPPAGFVLVLATAASMYLDLNGRVYLLRSLFFRRASQNVVSPGASPGAPVRLYLCAHYDAAKTGALFDPKRVARISRLAERTRLPLSPFRILFWSMAALLPLLGLRLAGIDSGAVSVLQLVPTLLLLAGSFLLVDVELSEVVPGANDNASGVATVLALADELRRDPPENVDVWVLLTGGQECLAEGMHSFVRSHRRELARNATSFLCIDGVGVGELRYEIGAGPAVTFPMDRRLIELCGAVADADAEAGVDRARPLRHGFAGDALAARTARFAATTITATEGSSVRPARYHRSDDLPEAIDSTMLERAHTFALALVRAVDRDAARRGDATT